MMSLFTLIAKQLFIVFLILASLPAVITLLAKMRLLPLALYFAATELFFPKWSVTHQTECVVLLIVSMLYFIVMWALHIHNHRQEQRTYEEYLLSHAIPLYGADWTPDVKN